MNTIAYVELIEKARDDYEIGSPTWYQYDFLVTTALRAWADRVWGK